jgi:photosystem II stability/assembly factor-like uncharacterized protein
MGFIRVGTTEGVFLVEHQGTDFRAKETLLEGEDVVVLKHSPSDPNLLFAGTYGRGIFRSRDGGKQWERLSLEVEYIRAIDFAPRDPATLYVGTEPANLYRSRNDGDDWEDLRIRSFPESSGWSLPYSPRSGALRTLAFHSEHPQLIYGGVEQGGVIKSTDAGAHWTISRDGVNKDVHWLSVYPGDFRIVFAATGEGLYLTLDGGENWERLFEHYTRGVIVHPNESTFVFAGPARDVGEGGRILISRDRGLTWERTEGDVTFALPDMVEHFVIPERDPELVYAILSGGGLLYTSLDRVYWRRAEFERKGIQTLDFAT